MEDIPAIIGALFGTAVLIKAIIDAGKLPAGPTQAQRPGNPSRPSAVSVPIDPTPSNCDTTPLPADIPELDSEEIITIKRVNEIRTRLESRRAALSAMGLEITNLDKW